MFLNGLTHSAATSEMFIGNQILFFYLIDSYNIIKMIYHLLINNVCNNIQLLKKKKKN